MIENSHVSNYKSRKLLYLINIFIALIMRITKRKRNKTIWIFGCWNGKKYDDNSRYLYEYILTYYKCIKPIWITRNEDVYRKMYEQGCPVELSYSTKGKDAMKKAGVAFYTNGLDDFSDIAFPYGAKLIHLSHAAAGIKKSGFEKKNYKGRRFKLIFKRFKDSLFDWYRFDINIATSDESKKSHASTYGYDRIDKIKITGLPRNDLLVHSNMFNTMRPNYLNEKYKYILYLPTYRSYENNVIMDLIDSILLDEELNNLLETNFFKIIVKLHPEDSGICKGNNNVIFLNNDEVSSTQELLLWSEVLITDYSSCCMDFALKNQSVIIYAPDYQKYNTKNGIMDSWMTIFESDTVMKDPKSLKQQLRKICLGKNISNYSLTEWINKVYMSSELKDTTYCKNVIDEVNKIL